MEKNKERWTVIEVNNRDLHIAKLGFICAIMVIALHSYSIGDMFSGDTMLSVFGQNIISYVSHGLTTVAVPIFFFLSGYLLFKNVCSIEILFKKLKRRVKSLLLPYLCWNILYFVFYIISSNSPIRTESVQMDYSILGIIEAILFHKYCFNLWFLLNLIVFIFVCSIPMFFLLKTKVILCIWGLLLITTFGGDASINIVLTGEKITIFSLSYFVYWMLGVVCSKRKSIISSHKICLLGYLLMSVLVMYVKETNAFSRAECVLVLGNMLCFLMSVGIWISKVKVPQHNMNMILYGGAGFVQIVFTKVVVVLNGLINMPEILILLLYFLEVILTVVVCYYVGFLMKKYFNPVYTLFAGNR